MNDNTHPAEFNEAEFLREQALEREAYVRYDKLRTYRHPMPGRHPAHMAEIAVLIRMALIAGGMRP